jgi:hypothetical protein
MTRFTLAAGALLLGSSALAWAPSTVPAADSDKAPTVAVDPGVKAPPAKAEAASASWIADDQILAETTPQAAAGNYPPCSPGPGDDHCIQLYEPGVRAQLAAWDRATGTLAENSATDEPADTALAAEMGAAGTYTGMGGPEEPADGSLAMNGDGVVDATLGETAADEGAAAGYTGVGGPLEEVADVATTEYPPCSPGPGDDRCIQLYERGVTGR